MRQQSYGPKLEKIFFSIMRFEKLIFVGHLGEKTAYFGLNFFQKILVFDWEPKKNFRAIALKYSV